MVEKYDPLVNRWQECGKTGPDDTSLTVEGLQKGHEYKFRVRAVNAEGASDPLEATDKIIAKEAYDVPGKVLKQLSVSPLAYRRTF